ncbi:MAG: poly-beta-1,6-N-acetyl-D-glucosamine N-deacetylase PgaB [Mariprofundaceae bacterium]
MKHALLLTAMLLLPWQACAQDDPRTMQVGEFLVLAYHAVPAKPMADDVYSVSQALFIEQMEYLRRHGYHPVSLNDILEASIGKNTLPPRAVLLSFDDAYISYHDFVVPLLTRFGYPSMLAVAGRLIDHPPQGLPEPLMSWKEIRAVAENPLVEIASHTYDLHRTIRYNPAGNVASSISVPVFDPDTATYELPNAYAAKVEMDFHRQRRLFIDKLGRAPRTIVWPYGRHNAVVWDIAASNGFRAGFTLEWGLGHLSDLHAVPRIMIENESMQKFIDKLANPAEVQPLIRAMQVDIDAMFDNSFATMDAKLGQVIDRLVEMKVNNVYLQAFADPDGDGNIDSVYFPNRVLPMRADFFSHAAHQMSIHGIQVYAWMPILAITLPEKAMNAAFSIKELRERNTHPSHPRYARLTPFSSEVQRIVGKLYEDLAIHTQIAGILFQDDTCLAEHENIHPLALAAFKRRFGEGWRENNWQDPVQLAQWREFNTGALIEFSQSLMAKVRKYRPEAKFIWNLKAPMRFTPMTETRCAQNYSRFTQVFDQFAVTAYPQASATSKPLLWLKEMVNWAKNMSDVELEKIVFIIQTYDWNNDMWVDDKLLLEEIKTVIATGGRFVAYYPDNFAHDRPRLSTIRVEMSTQDHPYLP